MDSSSSPAPPPAPVDVKENSISYAFVGHVPTHARAADRFVDSTVVTSVLEKKILDVTTAILRLVDEELDQRGGGGGEGGGGTGDGNNLQADGQEKENVFIRNDSRKRNKLMDGEVAREVARMKMTEVAQRMKSRMHALKRTQLEKAFDSLQRAYQTAREEFARCRLHSLKELHQLVDQPLDTASQLLRNLFLISVRLAVVGTVHEYQDKEKKLISTGFELVTLMNDAKMVKECCEIFVEDEEHLEGFMFNRRPEEKMKRKKAKHFLKEVVDINKLFAASLESLQRFDELLSHWPKIQHCNGSFNPVLEFYVLQRTEVYVPHEHVTTIVCYPNERMLYSGSEDGHLQLWDVDEMQLHQSILGHSRSSISAMNVGYGTVFTGSSTGLIKLWNWQPEDDVEKGGGIWQSYSIIQVGSRSVVRILLVSDMVIVGTQDGIVKIFHVSRMCVKKTIYVDHELIGIGLTTKEQKRKQKTFQNKNKPSFDKSVDDEDDEEEDDDNDDGCGAIKDKLLFCFQRHRISNDQSSRAANGAANGAAAEEAAETAPGVISVYDLETCLLVQEVHLLGLQVEARHPFAVSQDIFCIARRNEVVVFKTENLEEIENLKLSGHQENVTAVQIHGNIILTGCSGGDLMVWSLSSASPLLRSTFHLGHYGVSAIALTALDLQTLSKRATEFTIIEFVFAGCFDGTIVKIPLGFKSQKLKSYLQNLDKLRLAERERLKFKTVTGLL